jgi:hypothetical protein
LDAELVLDCQTKEVYLNCEYCIANKTCLIHENMEKDAEKKILQWLPEPSEPGRQ